MRAGIIGPKYSKDNYKIYEKIRDFLSSKGVNVDYSYFKTSGDEDYADLEQSYERNTKLLKSADFIVAETTEYASGIGYLIATALSLKKPVLALYNPLKGKKPSGIIQQASKKSKILSFFEYKEDNLEEAITKYLNKVKNILDTKFILIISPEIDRYLEWASGQKRMHKAQIVREAVEDMMRKDKDWKKTQD